MGGSKPNADPEGLDNGFSSFLRHSFRRLTNDGFLQSDAIGEIGHTKGFTDARSQAYALLWLEDRGIVKDPPLRETDSTASSQPLQIPIRIQKCMVWSWR